MGWVRRMRGVALARPILVVVLVAVSLPLLDLSEPAAAAASPQAGFVEESVLTGLTEPTTARFAADGRVFVAEKSGLVKVFDSLSDPTPTVFADLRTKVHNFWDRGLLGLELHPDFPATPFVYVLYTFDAAIGGTAPRWGTAGVSSDPCPTPPGPTGDGCAVGGRLSRLTAAGNVVTGPEQVLLEDWCQQYPGHSVGGLAFGPDGMLYVSGGDGAGFHFLDYGQDGSPVNPCGDPGGASPSPPTAEGGSLRAQDVRTSTDPVGLNGSILRIDPITGAGLADNPLGSSPDANARRMVATGLRNPFRFAVRPGTSEVWVGDVGWNDWEEIDVVANPRDGSIDNFGWPCYEGAAKQGGFDAADLSICEQLYAQPGAATDPYVQYHNSQPVVLDGACPGGSSAIAGLAFAPVVGGSYPADFAGAAFFADNSRNCIWVMKADSSGRPSPGLIETFVAGAASPVDLRIGPDGTLYYVDFGGGTVRRIRYVGDTTAPLVAAVAPASGATGVVVDANVAVTFSEPMDAGTVNTSTVVLHTGDASGPMVSAVVGYDEATRTATLDPVAALSPDTTFSVVVRGGAAGVKDAGGNPLAADESSSFVTAASAGSSVRFLSDLPFVGSPTNGWGPIERDRSNGEEDPADGVTMRVGAETFTKGLGAHASSEAVFAVPDGCTRFQARVGVDEEVGDDLGTVEFQVFAGSTQLGSTVARDGTQPSELVDVDVSGRSEIRLVVGPGADNIDADHADWGDAKYLCGAPDVEPVPPQPVILVPAVPTPWSVDEVVPFSGTATDAEDGNLAPSALTWSLVMQHCPSNCHSHVIQDFPGVASGSFAAPDHEYPSYLELRLTATDSSGLTTTVTRRLDPLTVDLTIASVPPGLQLVVDGGTATAPFTRTVIVGSAHTVAAATPQSLGGTSYEYVGWSDGGARSHGVVATAAPMLLTATFRDATRPTVSTVTPARNATGVSRTVSPTATFSEAMNPVTITTTTVRLRRGSSSGSVVTATVIYNPVSRTVTIDPVATLSANTTYTVVVSGGSSGVKDLAGNALAATYTWSFRTR